MHGKYEEKTFFYLNIRGVATGGGGGHVPPTNSRCPPPQKKKSCIYIFYLLISRVCKYFAPPQNHAYAFLKYALKLAHLIVFFYTSVNVFPSLPPSLEKWWLFFSFVISLFNFDKFWVKPGFSFTQLIRANTQNLGEKKGILTWLTKMIADQSSVSQSSWWQCVIWKKNSSTQRRIQNLWKGGGGGRESKFLDAAPENNKSRPKKQKSAEKIYIVFLFCL